MRTRDREATRQRLFNAARVLFAEHGYEQVTVRMIAAAADANVALVTRYFGSKAELFAEVVLGEPGIRQVFDGDPTTLPRRVAEYAAVRMYTEPESHVLRSLERSAGHPDVQTIIRERLRTAIIEPLTALLGGPDATERVRLATAIFLGIGAMRSMVGPAIPTPEEVDRLTSVFEQALAPHPHRQAG